MAFTTVPPSEYHNYSVVLVCALPSEKTIARAMLQAEHGSPQSLGDGDFNHYTLGKFGHHNIVIACLPEGAPGYASAAAVVENMQRTFQHIRICLFVGVGSGAPSASDDIRLGDVVVSLPSGGTGGMIRFERATAAAMPSTPTERATGGGGDAGARFVSVGLLAPPPTVLLTALSGLREEHQLADSMMGDIIAAAVKRYPKLRAALASPAERATAAPADCLYEAAYVHVGPRDTPCDGCDASRLVSRSDAKRPPGSFPVVHYGMIASGAYVLRSGLERDEARKALGVKCFESAAAGLADNFPCLVIRGVCDYADSHANSSWLSYAAGTAAAFAMELLASMPPQLISQAPTISDTMYPRFFAKEGPLDSGSTEADDRDDDDDEEDTNSSLASVKRAWESDYFGSPLLDLRTFISEFDKLPPCKIYARTVVFVQSSGMGKSRLAKEYGRTVCPMIGYCLRTNG
jgi:nucleoside phosphorylase